MKSFKTYIIAEAGVNHNGDLDLAKKLVGVAAKCGCNGVKFQTFRAERLVSTLAPKCDYQIEATGSEESQFEMLRKLELDEAAHIELMHVARDQNIDFISTPFDEESATMLVNLGVKYIKLPSGEINNLPFLSDVACLQRSIILSTGMAYLSEVDEAVRAIQDVWQDTPPEDENLPPLTLLHCLTEYPAPIEEVNLMAMVTLREAFKLPVGYSDHTPGIEVALAAVALEASIIEKHFTLDKNMEGPDHKASLEPCELKAMIQAIRNIEHSLGSGIKKPSPSEAKNRSIARKSIVAAVDIRKDEVFSEENMTVKRPGNGISPTRWDEVVGRVASRDYQKGQLIDF